MENQEKQRPISEETARKLAGLLAKTPTNAAVEFAKKPVYLVRQNQIIAGITATMGLIIFAQGIENWISSIPALSSPFIEMALGLILLVISGLYLKKLL